MALDLRLDLASERQEEREARIFILLFPPTVPPDSAGTGSLIFPLGLGWQGFPSVATPQILLQASIVPLILLTHL